MPSSRMIKMKPAGGGGANEGVIKKVVNEMLYTVKADEYSDELASLVNGDDELALLELINSDKSDFSVDVVLPETRKDKVTLSSAGEPLPTLVHHLSEWLVGFYERVIKGGSVGSIRIRVVKPSTILNTSGNLDNLKLVKRGVLMVNMAKTGGGDGDLDKLIQMADGGGGGGSGTTDTRFEAREVLTFNPIVPMIPSFSRLVTSTGGMVVSKGELIKGYEIVTDCEKSNVLTPTVFHKGRLTSKISKDYTKRMILMWDLVEK